MSLDLFRKADKLPRLNLLFSFAYVRGLDPMLDELLQSTNVLIDSGAFTNHQIVLKGGKPKVTLPTYLDFCKRVDGRVWNYIALDVIGKPTESERNLQVMLDAGLKPMPVFVHGTSYDKVGELCEINEGRICVAGGVKTKNNYIHYRYQKAFRESGGKAKIHGLGFVRCPEIFKLPLATVDSASYYNGSVFGKVFRYEPRLGEWFCPSYRELRKKPEYQQTLRDLARCGITAEYMNDPANTRGLASWPSFFTVNSYFSFHEHTTRIGPSYFFAIPGASWVIALAAVLSTRKGKYFNYPESRDTYVRLNEAYKANKSLTSQEVGRIFRENTSKREPNGIAKNFARAADRAV